MKTFRMNIDKVYFDNVRNQTKIHEYRLANEKRRLIKVGDLINLTLKDMSDFELVEVKDIHFYSSWREAFESTENYLDDFKGICNNIDEVLERVKVFYNEDDVKKYGIVVFDIKKI